MHEVLSIEIGGVAYQCYATDSADPNRRRFVIASLGEMVLEVETGRIVESKPVNPDAERVLVALAPELCSKWRARTNET